MKKLMSLLLAAALMVGLAVPAFAAPVNAEDGDATMLFSDATYEEFDEGHGINGWHRIITVAPGSTVTLTPGIYPEWYDGSWPCDRMGIDANGDFFRLKDGEVDITTGSVDRYFVGETRALYGTMIDEYPLIIVYGGEPVKPTAKPAKFAATLDGSPIDLTAFVINDFNHIKLRDMAALLKDTGAKFNVGWDGKSVTLTTGETYTPGADDLADVGTASKTYTENKSAIVVDGKTVELTAYNIDGYNYFQLRDLGEALGFNVGWDNASRTVTIGTK